MDLKSLKIEHTLTSPLVILDIETYTLLFEGRGICEEPIQFFKPIFEWINILLENFNFEREIELIFKFEYYNSVTLNNITKIIAKFEELSKKGAKITIKWYCHQDDEIEIDDGENLKAQLSFPFEIILF